MEIIGYWQDTHVANEYGSGLIICYGYGDWAWGPNTLKNQELSWCLVCCYWWHQWWQSWHNDNTYFSVKILYIPKLWRCFLLCCVCCGILVMLGLIHIQENSTGTGATINYIPRNKPKKYVSYSNVFLEENVCKNVVCQNGLICSGLNVLKAGHSSEWWMWGPVVCQVLQIGWCPWQYICPPIDFQSHW